MQVKCVYHKGTRYISVKHAFDFLIVARKVAKRALRSIFLFDQKGVNSRY